MSIETSLGQFFKAEAMAAGAKLYRLDKVSIPGGTDTTVDAYIRIAPPLTVRLRSSGIESDTINVDCSCPIGKKGRLCKHVWAALLGAEAKLPDFMNNKSRIEKFETPVRETARTPEATAKAELSAQLRAARAENQRLRANEYRREQYQKMKERSKAYRAERKQRSAPEPAPEPTLEVLPPAVEEACEYFSQNGFPMVPKPSATLVAEAKKKLSRVFHPDRGGSHDEITELNRHTETIYQYLNAHGAGEIR